MALYASRFWLCGPRARVVTVPVHAVCFNEDRRGRWWRVNYNLMLESNTISPFITPQCHGLTGSHQFVKGTHTEKAMLRSVLCGTEESELDEDFRYQINTVRFTKEPFSCFEKECSRIKWMQDHVKNRVANMQVIIAVRRIWFTSSAGRARAADTDRPSFLFSILLIFIDVVW